MVQLYRRPQGRSGFEHACSSPCDMDLPLGDDYHLIGSGMPQTKDFSLQGSPGDRVTLAVSPPSIGGILGGGTLIGVGSMVMYIGALVALAGSGESDSTCVNGRCSSSSSGGGAVSGGLIALAVGAGATALGTALLIGSMGTDVNQGASAAHESHEHEASKDAFLRQATWRAPSSAEAAQTSAPAFMLPVRFSF
jgi:hypothetical protein